VACGLQQSHTASSLASISAQATRRMRPRQWPSYTNTMVLSGPPEETAIKGWGGNATSAAHLAMAACRQIPRLRTASATLRTLGARMVMKPMSTSRPLRPLMEAHSIRWVKTTACFCPWMLCVACHRHSLAWEAQTHHTVPVNLWQVAMEVAFAAVHACHQQVWINSRAKASCFLLDRFSSRMAWLLHRRCRLSHSPATQRQVTMHLSPWMRLRPSTAIRGKCLRVLTGACLEWLQLWALCLVT